MTGLTYLALLALPVCAAVIAYLMGYDSGYLRARHELRETSARRAPADPGRDPEHRS